jgi:hypothetical protein
LDDMCWLHCYAATASRHCTVILPPVSPKFHTSDWRNSKLLKTMTSQAVHGSLSCLTVI